MQQCIDECLECYRTCLETKSYCIEKDGKHTGKNHLRTLSDCLELCKMSAHFMIKESKFSLDLRKICAKSCSNCAQSCEEFKNDQYMQDCAKTCRRTQKCCEEMS